jgi:ferredoxin-like protein FixX
MLTHEEEKPHKCRVPDCNRTYCDARSLKRHIENAHQNILAAIHEGGHDEYRNFLPETAFVKTKDLSSDFSIDSIESNSPRSSSIDNEQTFHITQQIRSSNGNKLAPTYTYVLNLYSIKLKNNFSFDEEKCVECQICKKSFKNGAALNGHMRLHGGFNDVNISKSFFCKLISYSFRNKHLHHQLIIHRKNVI